MKFKTPKNENYAATIIDIKNIIPLMSRKGEICNTIVGTSIFGNHVIVGNDTKVGDIGIFFPVETKLSNDFLKANNLYRHSELNWDENHNGFFEENGRIRAVKLQGHPSMGLFMPLTSIGNIFDMKDLVVPDLNSGDNVDIGDTFDEFAGIVICEKYISKQRMKGERNKNMGKVKRVSKLVDNQFRLHYQTSHLGKNIHLLNPESLVSITRKLHGCVSGDTIVETKEYGKLPISKIVNEEINCLIKAFDIKTNKIVFVPIDQYYLKKNNGDWYEIELEDGSKIKITGNNPVWLPKLKCYRRVDELSINDSLLKK